MPRPKPLEPLKPREIRLSDKDWQTFRSSGGVDALRMWLNRTTKSAARRKARDEAIRADLSCGLPVAVLVSKYALSKTTIYRITR